jgi:hypothetical protein
MARIRVGVVIDLSTESQRFHCLQPGHASSWDGDGDGGRDPDSQVRSQNDGAAKSGLLESISNLAGATTISDFVAPISGVTVLDVTRGVAHSLVPDAGRPRDASNRQFRSLAAGSASHVFAPRRNYRTRPYVQSIKGIAAQASSLGIIPNTSGCSASIQLLPGPYALSEHGWHLNEARFSGE